MAIDPVCGMTVDEQTAPSTAVLRELDNKESADENPCSGVFMNYVRRCLRCLLVLLPLAILVGSCSAPPIPRNDWHVLPGDWHPNTNVRDTGGLTRANFQIDDAIRKDGMLVGVAISGGGLRAANFGAAVMLELKAFGVLDQVDFLSPVSGGALPAAYLALDGYKYQTWLGERKISFQKDELKDALSQNLQMRWVGSWLLPHNIFRFWLTNFNRSDIMFQIFEDNLFHGATYADLNPNRPKLLINTTKLEDLEQFGHFVYSDEFFSKLGSNLSPYRVSGAVQASSAVPGVWNSVVLADYTNSKYLHLYDGVMADNLGLSSLLQVLKGVDRNADTEKEKLLKCVLISIDATPRFSDHYSDRDDIREILKDFLVERNASDAVDDILRFQRMETFRQFGVSDESIVDKDHFIVFRAPGFKDDRCILWHIALRMFPVSLPPLPGTPPEKTPLGWQLTLIPTQFEIEEWQQNALFEAAHKLVEYQWAHGASSLFE